MKEKGVTNFMVNGGGDIYVSGLNKDSAQWVIGIEHPRDKNSLVAKLELSNLALGTSGDYERFVIIDGKRYHHIFDTRTGYPAPLSESASAIAPTAEEAVILSKYLFIIGSEKYIDFMKESGVEGVIVDSSGNVSHDPKTNILTIKTESNPYKPINVFKCLLCFLKN